MHPVKPVTDWGFEHFSEYKVSLWFFQHDLAERENPSMS